MPHAMYHHCRQHLHKPVTIHHRDGRRYHGYIRHVTPDGIYFSPHAGAGVVSDSEHGLHAQTLDNQAGQQADATEVFWGAAFIPFVALAGLTLGFAAGAAAAYPYYGGYGGYGYGYGRGYYW